MTDQLELRSLEARYTANRSDPILFDFRAASQKLMGDLKKSKDIHYYHYYPGRIFPYIPYFLLSLEAFDTLDLLDPFCGSGTTLLESLIHPTARRNALGVEINPLGRLISKVKTTSLDTEEIGNCMQTLSSLMKDAKNIGEFVPRFENVELWFSENAIKKLARLKSAIHHLDAGQDYKDFLWVCFSSIIRKVSKADPYIPPPVVLKPEKYRENPRKYQRLKEKMESASNPKVWSSFKGIVHDNKKRLESLNGFVHVRKGAVRAEVIWDDARVIKRGRLCECGRMNKNASEEFPDGHISLIFTSPPYLTAQKYIRTSKLELFWLGYSQEEVRALSKASIGTERISLKSEIEASNIESIDLVIEYALSGSRRRAIMISQYFKGMTESLREMFRLLRKGGYAILVVGDNKVLDRTVPTYRLLSDAAIEMGFEEKTILKDTIRSRSMMTRRHGTGGIIRNEYVVILRKG